MDFTRQPIIETVITAKEGCKLVIRSSKSAGQEEYFVDSIEVVSFGNTFFLRSQEKPKSFLVPASDYEVLEVREARMVLKNVGMNRSIKIGGGKERATKESEKSVEKTAEKPVEKAPEKPAKVEEQEVQDASRQTERKRDRRRSFRRRKRGEDQSEQMEQVVSDIPLIPPPPIANHPIKIPEQKAGSSSSGGSSANFELSPLLLGALLPPPPTLISETIEKYKDNKLFEGVFVGSSKRGKASSEQITEEEPAAFEEKEEDSEGCYSGVCSCGDVDEEFEGVEQREIQLESFEEAYLAEPQPEQEKSASDQEGD